MSFKFSSFLLTVLPLIFLLKFSDYYISSFFILKIINCMCEMSHWMSFEVDRYSSAWAHIALCADLTWATEPPDEFIIANQVPYRKWQTYSFCGQNLSWRKFFPLVWCSFVFSVSGHNIVVSPKYCKTHHWNHKVCKRIINAN